MRISDWSSDVCSSDLFPFDYNPDWLILGLGFFSNQVPAALFLTSIISPSHADRKSAESGKSVSVRVAHGGRRILKNKKKSSIDEPYTTDATTCMHSRVVQIASINRQDAKQHRQ